MTKRKGIVEKERVVCQNCRYQYSFLYEAREAVTTPSPSMSGNLVNYVNPRESYRPCPHCGFVQDWMAGAWRRHRLTDLALAALIGASGVLIYLAYQMIAVALNPLAEGGFEPVYQAQTILAGYLGLVALAAAAYFAYLHWIWDPNKDVDTKSYEAASPESVCPEDAITAASQYEAAARLTREVEMPQKHFFRPLTSLSWTQKSVMLAGIVIGVGSFIAPALSPDLALELASRGLTMAPFYLGVGFMLIAAVSGSWQYLDDLLR